jgi:diadenosine tetraphosphate (Ap4A) HIT family hydrolase
MLIYETDHFDVVVPVRPHIDRLDGGHIKIVPKVRVSDRTELPRSLAVELMLLSCLVGRAMSHALPRQGIDIGRINYQENGNWGVFREEGPYLHLHLYGRAKSAVTQTYGEALHLPNRDTGFYVDCTPLNQDDVEAIRQAMGRFCLGEGDAAT